MVLTFVAVPFAFCEVSLVFSLAWRLCNILSNSVGVESVVDDTIDGVSVVLSIAASASAFTVAAAAWVALLLLATLVVELGMDTPKCLLVLSALLIPITESVSVEPVSVSVPADAPIFRSVFLVVLIVVMILVVLMMVWMIVWMMVWKIIWVMVWLVWRTSG